VTQPGPGLLNRDTILAYLQELSAALELGVRHHIVLAGGSFLALHNLRAATRDIDSLTKLDPDLRDTAARVGARHDLAPHWLNDDASMFAPQGLREDMCSPVVDTPTLLVLEPPARFVFAMKLYSLRAADTADLPSLWPLTGFDTAEEAVAFMERCYPHSEPDPHLAEFLRARVLPD
jgi:hypothetical protein